MPASFARAALCAVGLLLAAPTAFAQSNVLFIFDASGSMKQPAGGESRIAVAKKAMDAALKDVPQGTRLGLLMYGHRRANDCTDIELVSPIGADDSAAINRRIQSADAKGETPIAEALRQAARSFAALKGQANSIVLVTDGIEECKGDPCAAAREIKASGLDIKAHVVGFTLTDQQRKLVQCIPDLTGGKYFEAKDAGGLNKALADVRQQTAQAPPPPPPPPQEFNLLAPGNGGQLIAAPEENWKLAIGGDEGKWSGANDNQEAVFAFKDEGPATFDKFSILIPSSGAWVKDFELLVADSVGGPWRSVGAFATQNLRLLRTPFQEFKFPETTARYLKIKTISGHGRTAGGWFLLPQIRLIGKLGGQAAAPAAAPAAAGSVNLLAPASGGQVLVAPTADWAKVVSGDEKAWVGTGENQEAVFGFKDGRPARFDRFAMLVPEAGAWVKDFEVLAADDPGGPWRSLGSFTTQNLRLVKTPFQEFPLPETTARFVKIKTVSGHARTANGSFLLPQVRLFGMLDAAAPASAAAAAPRAGQVNLLSARNGGQLLAAPNNDWAVILSGDEGKWVGANDGQEVLFAFKDEKPATFSRIGLLIPGTGPWVKQFEVLVADEVGGPFRSVGSFTTQNARLLQSPYQPFSFPETTAKYVKVKLLSGHGRTAGGWYLMTQIELMGTPN